MDFDFEGEFTDITPQKSITYKLEDTRQVTLEFIAVTNAVNVIETFDIEDENNSDRAGMVYQKPY